MDGHVENGFIYVKNFINGEFSTTAEYVDSIDPSTGKVWAKIPDSGEEEVARAVGAARAAFEKWSSTPAAVRSKLMSKLADLIEQQLDELAAAESKDQGKPVSLARRVDIPRAVLNFRSFAETIHHELNTSNYLEDANCLNYTIRHPVGVAALISPWNLPLYLLTFKIAPAIAAGNTVVCKPSEITSVTAFMICRLIKEAGIPDGVVNMVFGTGPRAGEALINHPDVRVISFTGSTAVGRHVADVAAKSFKKVSLELGGKNAGIFFDDIDIAKTIPSVLNSCFLNQGEVCLCTSRLFVHKNIYDDFVRSLVEQTKKLTVGPPHEDVFMGAVASEVHYDKIKTYINYAVEDGGEILCGETVDPLDLPGEHRNGFFLRPTVIVGLSDDSRCMQDEIFGPVVCITPFETEDEVVRRANGVKYGLCAAVWGRDGGRVLRTAQKLKVGTVWVNCWLIRSLDMPFGGQKESGTGREGTKHSLDLFTEETTICYKIA